MSELAPDSTATRVKSFDFSFPLPSPTTSTNATTSSSPHDNDDNNPSHLAGPPSTRSTTARLSRTTSVESQAEFEDFLRDRRDTLHQRKLDTARRRQMREHDELRALTASLGPEVVRRYKEIFQAVNVTGSGRCSRIELKAALGVTDERVEELFARGGFQERDQLDLKEFIEAMTHPEANLMSASTAPLPRRAGSNHVTEAPRTSRNSATAQRTISRNGAHPAPKPPTWPKKSNSANGIGQRLPPPSPTTRRSTTTKRTTRQSAGVLRRSATDVEQQQSLQIREPNRKPGIRTPPGSPGRSSPIGRSSSRHSSRRRVPSKQDVNLFNVNVVQRYKDMFESLQRAHGGKLLVADLTEIIDPDVMEGMRPMCVVEFDKFVDLMIMALLSHSKQITDTDNPQ